MRTLLIFLLCPLLATPVRASRAFSNSSDTLTGGTTALPTTGSFSCQVYPTFAQGDSAYHILFEVLDGSNYVQILKASSNNIAVNWSNGTLYQAFVNSGSYTLNTNAWNTLGATWTNGAFLRLYLNGSKIAEINGMGTYSTAATWSIGNRSTGGFPWNGNVARCGMWNRELTTTEMTTLSGSTNKPSDVASGLIHEWDLLGSALTDSVGSMTLSNSGPTVGSDPPSGGGGTAARRRTTSQ